MLIKKGGPGYTGPPFLHYIYSNKSTIVNPKKPLILAVVLSSAILLYSYMKAFQDKADRLSTPNTHILYRVGFEEKDPFPSFLSKQIATPYGLQVIDRPVYQGKKAARFELRDGDPENNNGTRTEISFPNPESKINLERWYAFALFFPHDGYEPDSSDEVISQWHQGGKTSPSLCIRTKNDRIILRIRSGLKNKERIELGVIEKDVWHYYVMHIKHSAGVNGLIEVWRDGVSIAKFNGANMYDLSDGIFHTPNWKLGIYKASWNGSAITTTKKRVLFIDEIKLGNELSTYADMIINPKQGK